MERKMIVMDLDGTLLNNEKRVEEKSINYLRSLKEKGHVITIATGRNLGSALSATDGAEFANYIVSDAGAVVYKTNKWNNIYINSIPEAIANRILSYFDESKFKCINICDKNYYYKYTKYYFGRSKADKNFTNKDEILKQCGNITHISIDFLNNEAVDEYYKSFSLKFPELSINTMQDSFDDKKWLEITMNGVSKYNGILEIAKHEDILNENIIAFGDGLNDIDMIEGCGTGVAMNNALKEVKEVSNYVTEKTNNENGIIEFLKEYLKEQ